MYSRGRSHRGRGGLGPDLNGPAGWPQRTKCQLARQQCIPIIDAISTSQRGPGSRDHWFRLMMSSNQGQGMHKTPTEVVTPHLRGMHQMQGPRLKRHPRRHERSLADVRHRELNENDLVWKISYQQSDAARYFSAKLAPKFVGPFTVSRKISPLIYELKDQKGKSICTWHIEDLKPFVSLEKIAGNFLQLRECL
ncbi:hypothetical protein J6590_099575 [Homalodisca vitripennis]|nr:hypothetical protein J6590_099575 [Homalodisca vitripennis]